jgi:spermidine synthase
MSDVSRPKLREFAAIALVSCAMLIHEILLTRICALRLQFHFAFLVISNCLLGLGAAGSVLSSYQTILLAEPRKWLARLSITYFVSLIATYVCLIRIPLPDDIQLSHPGHVLVLCAFNLIGAVPFFFSGSIIGLLLTLYPRNADRLYAADLLGAGIGCIACPGLLPLVGAGGVFVASALLSLFACGCLLAHASRPRYLIGAALVCVGLALLPTMDRLLPVPSKPIRDLTTRVLRPDQVRSVWTANSRIDLVTPPRCDLPIFMRGAFDKLPAPKECAEIAQDATAATTIIDFSEEPAALEILKRSMYSAAYRLKSRPSVLVIGLGGGNDVWAAKANGARSVRAIELNWPIVGIHKSVLRRFSQTLIDDASVQFVVDEGRSALMRDTSAYDVVQMTGIDTWTALASGGYVMAENYLYTREAITSMYQHLKPDGILQISRFAASMEALRLLSNIDSALHGLDVSDVERSVIVLATPDFMMSVQIKKGLFSDEEQREVVRFSQENGILLPYLPNRPLPALLDQFLRSSDKQKVIDAFPENIAPTSDDRPYFFNFTKWQHPIDSIRHIGDIPAVSQGNPFFLLAQLLLSVVLSALLIIWPLSRQQGLPGLGAARLLVFFSALGIGFISIEITMLQKLTLLLGQPVYSLTVTLFSLLIFAGLGSSQLAPRLSKGGRAIWIVPVGILAYVALFNACSASLIASWIGAALPLRIAVSLLLLAPLGLLLGVPFAYGLRVAHECDPRLTPWAWAINGCLSVVGSILTVVVSMNFGFAVVLWLAALVYLVGFVALIPMQRLAAPSS